LSELWRKVKSLPKQLIIFYLQHDLELAFTSFVPTIDRFDNKS